METDLTWVCLHLSVLYMNLPILRSALLSALINNAAFRSTASSVAFIFPPYISSTSFHCKSQRPNRSSRFSHAIFFAMLSVTHTLPCPGQTTTVCVIWIDLPATIFLNKVQHNNWSPQWRNVMLNACLELGSGLLTFYTRGLSCLWLKAKKLIYHNGDLSCWHICLGPDVVVHCKLLAYFFLPHYFFAVSLPPTFFLCLCKFTLSK